jgi:hypothetical protein
MLTARHQHRATPTIEHIAERVKLDLWYIGLTS